MKAHDSFILLYNYGLTNFHPGLLTSKLKAMCQMKMVQAMRAFLEFCYIARRDVHDTHSLEALEDCPSAVFTTIVRSFGQAGVRTDGFNLPRQHSLIHYIKTHSGIWGSKWFFAHLLQSPKHIKAHGREPWRRSNRFEEAPLSDAPYEPAPRMSLQASHADFC